MRAAPRSTVINSHSWRGRHLSSVQCQRVQAVRTKCTRHKKSKVALETKDGKSEKSQLTNSKAGIVKHARSPKCYDLPPTWSIGQYNNKGWLEAARSDPSLGTRRQGPEGRLSSVSSHRSNKRTWLEATNHRVPVRWELLRAE